VPSTRSVYGSSNPYAFDRFDLNSFNQQAATTVYDVQGNPLPATSFSFTTGDHIAPTVTSVTPSDGRVSVWRGVSPRITFSEGVRNVSTATLRLRNLRTGDLVAVKVTYSTATHVATIDPTFRLTAGTWYQIKVRSEIEDLAGNNISTRLFTFKTRS